VSAGDEAPSISEYLSMLGPSIDKTGLPEVVIREAKSHFLDGLGITVSGSSTSIGAVARRYLEAAGRLQEGDFGWGWLSADPTAGGPFNLEDLAFLLGSYAFSENYGDTSLRSVAHPNTVIVPVLLAAARYRPVSGERLLNALVIGYQVMEHLARSLNNGNPRMAHQIRGFRPTATCGAAGAAASLAYLWGLDQDATRRSIEQACNYGGGLRRHGMGTESSIRVQSGEATRRGVTAVLLTLSGLQGEQHLIEGEGGFFSAYGTGALDQSAGVYLPRGSGLPLPERWAIADVAFKLHCTPHTLATAMDCILDIMGQNKVVLAEVTSVEVAVPEQHVTISASEPYQPPRNPNEAAGSYPFCCGAVLATADFIWPNVLSDLLNDEGVLRAARRVTVVASEAQSSEFEAAPGTWPASVTVVAGGKRLSAAKLKPFGSVFDNDVRLQVQRKFQRLLETEVLNGTAESVIEIVDHLEAEQNVCEALTRVMRK